MNKVILMGRLTRDPEVRYSQGDSATAIARYTLAVDRRFKTGRRTLHADFIPLCGIRACSAEFAEKYFRQGMRRFAFTGRIQTGSYTNKDGVKVYTTEVIVEDQEFAESRAAAVRRRQQRRRCCSIRQLRSPSPSVACRRRIHEHPGRDRRRITV